MIYEPSGYKKTSTATSTATEKARTEKTRITTSFDQMQRDTHRGTIKIAEAMALNFIDQMLSSRENGSRGAG